MIILSNLLGNPEKKKYFEINVCNRSHFFHFYLPHTFLKKIQFLCFIFKIESQYNMYVINDKRRTEQG
jgi:hypothetical protein